MYYVTGDIHGNQVFWDSCITEFLKPEDTIIVAGDFGIGFFDGRFWTEEMFLDSLAEQKYTILFCDGNHENFDKLNDYAVSSWGGGRVHFIRDNVIHLMRGEIYEIEGKKLFVMGGGYSLDKDVRKPGKSWWPEEMPDASDYQNAGKNLKSCDYKVDYILSHTAPCDTVEYLAHLNLGINGNIKQEAELTGFLEWVENSVRYDKWYFGHFHVDAELWKGQYVLYKDIRQFFSGSKINNIKHSWRSGTGICDK